MKIDINEISWGGEKLAFNEVRAWIPKDSLPLGSWKLVRSAEKIGDYLLTMAEGNDLKETLQRDPVAVNNKLLEEKDLENGSFLVRRGDKIMTHVENVNDRGTISREVWVYSVPTLYEEVADFLLYNDGK